MVKGTLRWRSSVRRGARGAASRRSCGCGGSVRAGRTSASLAHVPPQVRRGALREAPVRDARVDHAEGQASRAGGPLDVARLGAYMQLRLGRSIVADWRLSWERRLAAQSLTLIRALRSFATLLPSLGMPASAPKPRGRSPGCPKWQLSRPAKRLPGGQESRLENPTTAPIGGFIVACKNGAWPRVTKNAS